MPRRLFHLFPTFGVGGSQVRLAQVLNHFGPRYQHTIFATDGVYDAMGLIQPHVPIRKLEATYDKRRGVRNVPLYARTIRESGADVVVTHNWGTIEWALATRFVRGVRHIHIEDGFGPDEANRQLPRRIWFRRLALTGGRTTVVVPSHVLYDLATRVWRLPKRKIEFIANGIDLQRFARVDVVEARALAKKAAGEVLIGTVATLRPEKNLGLLIQAFAMLEGPVRLMIVGDGSERARLEEIARGSRAAARISFFGHTREPERVMRAFDIFAMSSNTEQMPIGLLEAMAGGLPVAATDVGDTARMVAAENRGLITPAGDLPAFVRVLQELVANAGARAALGARNAAKVAAEYDQGAMFKRYAALFG